MAILVAMRSEQMSLAEVKNRLSEIVETVEQEHGRLVITKHGRPAAVVLSLDDLDGLEETLDIMSHTALLNDIREALDGRRHGEPAVLSEDEALRLVTRE